MPGITQAPGGHVQLFSRKEPTLPSGKYTLDVHQTITSPEDPSNPIVLKTTKKLTVTGPRFRLDPAADIHSVYPPQGHSDYANTLAHVVLNSPTAPWDRSVNSGQGDLAGLNRTPWMAVLVFTEDELVLDSAWLTERGLPAESNTFCIPVTPEKLQASAAAAIASPFKANPDGTFPLKLDEHDGKESMHVIMLKTELFKALFGKYTDTSATAWDGKASLERYSYLAHVKKVFTGKSSEANEYSVLVSHRTGPPDVSSSKSVVAHLVSLEGLDKMEIGKDHSHVAVVSLYAWNWTCIPSNEANFIHALQGIGSNVQPLRAPKKKLDSLAPGGKTEGLEPARAWLYEKLKEGYVLKKWTLPTGEPSATMFRGPLSPVLPANTEEKGVKPWSLLGTDLQVLDSKVGIVDGSYNIAWQLGKVLAIGDRSFVTSLLQLRGNIHSAALKSAKATLDDTHISTTDFLGALKNAVNTAQSATNPSTLTQRSMASRWARVPVQGPARSEMLTSQHPLVREEYVKQVEQLVLGQGDSDFTPGKALYNDFQSPKNPDWAIVIKWVLDKLFLADIPRHYVIPDPDYIPPESIRTFYIDSVWLEALIDGALSLANHFDREDDVIRRALKANINQYLSHTLHGVQPQIPRWGLLMRSSVISALPDLQINAPWPEDQKQRREVLLTQKLSDDTILCLFGRHPEDGTLTSITISQPAHQQGFSCGADLDGEKVEVEFRSMANKDGATESKIGHTLGLKTWRNPSIKTDQSQQSEKPDIYDWKNRTVILPAFAKRCIEELTKTGDFELKKDDPCPSSVIGTQLTSAAFKLTLNVGATKKHLDSSNNPGSGHGQLYIPPKRKLQSSVPFQPSPSHFKNPAEATTPLPIGRRSRVVGIVPDNIPHKAPNENQEGQLEQYIEPWNLGRSYQNFSIASWADKLSCGCWPLLGSKGSPIPVSTAKGPLDLVFEWRHPGEWAGNLFYYEQIEVLFPIADPNNYPHSGEKGSEPALFTLFTPPGSNKKPAEGSVVKNMWPKVHGIGRGSRWIYDTRVVQGSLYESYMAADWPWPKYRHKPKPNRLFVVRIRPRTNGEPWGRRGPMDASFVLSGVHTTGIVPGERVKIEVVTMSWSEGGFFVDVDKS